MRDKKSDAASAADAEACRRLLRALSAKNMSVEPRPDGSVILLRSIQGKSKVAGACSAVHWERAIKSYWVCRTNETGGWRLTVIGRSHLRRLSCSAAPKAALKSPQEALRGGNSGPSLPGYNTSESPLAWLRHRRDKEGVALISDIEFQAGERLRADFHFAHLEPRVTANWSPAAAPSSGRRSAPGVGIELQDHVIAAGERVHRALAAVGADFAGILIDVCCHLKGLEVTERDRGLPKRSGKVILQYALRHLARHYGLDRAAAANNARSGTIRHWGSDDYRPSIDAGREEGGR